MQAGSGCAREPGRRGPARLALRAWVACALLACAVLAWVPAAGAAPSNDDVPPKDAPQGRVSVDRALRDPDFGVETRHPGLQRHVEMYQWTRDGSGYALAWRGARVDSSGFAPGHENPRSMPLREREWRAPVRLDGRRVPDGIVFAQGRWKPFRPNFSALPGNMSATFQPEGDGLGSAENPLAPRVGDLRVTWREFVLPPLAGRLVLRDGEWRLPDGVPDDAAAAPPPPRPARAQAPQPGDEGLPRWLWAAAPLLVLLLGVAVVRRRAKRRS